LRYDVPVDDPRFGESVPCHCKEREIQARRLRVLSERSNLGALREMTFESFIVDAPQRTAFNRARQFAAHPEGWLVIMGGYGVGKTHLAAAIGNYRLENGEPVLFQVVPDLLDHLRAAYAPGSEAGYDELFESVRQVPLLILDDLGTQISTQWAQEKLFQLLNHRHNFKLPTVITTNKSFDEMEPRLASRMADAQISACVTIIADDFRGGVDNRTRAERTPERGGRRFRSQRSGIEFTDRL
jgi:DNA replication protein DnaC